MTKLASISQKLHSVNFVIHLSIYLTLSFEKGIFQDYMKIEKVTPVFKGGDSGDLSNYCPIAVLLCFSKILERLMYNRLYKHLSNLKMFYPKQFHFQSAIQLMINYCNLLTKFTNL